MGDVAVIRGGDRISVVEAEDIRRIGRHGAAPRNNGVVAHHDVLHAGIGAVAADIHAIDIALDVACDQYRVVFYQIVAAGITVADTIEIVFNIGPVRRGRRILDVDTIVVDMIIAGSLGIVLTPAIEINATTVVAYDLVVMDCDIVALAVQKDAVGGLAAQAANLLDTVVIDGRRIGLAGAYGAGLDAAMPGHQDIVMDLDAAGVGRTHGDGIAAIAVHGGRVAVQLHIGAVNLRVVEAVAVVSLDAVRLETRYANHHVADCVPACPGCPVDVNRW